MKKLILIILISSLFIYFIYIITDHTKLNILSIGDLYSNGYNDGFYPSYNDYFKDYLKKFDNYDVLALNNTTELFDFINDNNELNNKHIKKIIKDSNLIIINTGIQELNSVDNNVNSNYINNYLSTYEKLINVIYKLNHNLLIVNLPKDLKISNKYRLIINDYYDGLANKYHINIIDIRNEDIKNTNLVIYQALINQKLTS